MNRQCPLPIPLMLLPKWLGAKSSHRPAVPMAQQIGWVGSGCTSARRKWVAVHPQVDMLRPTVWDILILFMLQTFGCCYHICVGTCSHCFLFADFRSWDLSLFIILTDMLKTLLDSRKTCSILELEPHLLNAICNISTKSSVLEVFVVFLLLEPLIFDPFAKLWGLKPRFLHGVYHNFELEHLNLGNLQKIWDLALRIYTPLAAFWSDSLLCTGFQTSHSWTLWFVFIVIVFVGVSERCFRTVFPLSFSKRQVPSRLRPQEATEASHRKHKSCMYLHVPNMSLNELPRRDTKAKIRLSVSCSLNRQHAVTNREEIHEPRQTRRQESRQRKEKKPMQKLKLSRQSRKGTDESKEVKEAKNTI